MTCKHDETCKHEFEPNCVSPCHACKYNFERVEESEFQKAVRAYVLKTQSNLAAYPRSKGVDWPLKCDWSEITHYLDGTVCDLRALWNTRGELDMEACQTKFCTCTEHVDALDSPE